MPVALRYFIEFDAVTLRVLRRVTLDKVTPPSYTPEGEPGASGFWLELRNSANDVLYRRVMDDPYYRFEGPSDDNGTLRTVAQSEPRRGLFTVVVPYLPGAATLVFMASRPPDERAAPIANITVETPV